MTPEHTALKQELSDLHDWLENPTNNEEDDERVQKKWARLVQLTGVLIDELEAKPSTPPSVLNFPSLLLKQWTGDEVQAWINEQLAKQPTPEIAAWRVTDAKGGPLTGWTSGEPNKNIIDHEWTQGKRVELSYKAPLPASPSHQIAEELEH